MKIFRLRRLSQNLSTVLHNGYLGFLSTGNIYTGYLKRFFGFGLNCYTCPAALYSCLLVSMQQIMISPRILPITYLSHVVLYLLVPILLFSHFLGRFVLRFFCKSLYSLDLIYGILNTYSLCEKICPMDLKLPKDLNLVECNRYLGYLILCPNTK
ncbi:MAG: hypothetical protein ABWJ99_02795 [Caldimicrobium sp.]